MNTIWDIINTALIFMLGMFIYFNKAIHTQAVNEVQELKVQVDNQQKMIDFLVTSSANRCDTTIITINNNIKEPRTKYILVNDK